MKLFDLTLTTLKYHHLPKDRVRTVEMSREEEQTWGACTYAQRLALVVCVRIAFCPLQVGVVVSVPV